MKREYLFVTVLAVIGVAVYQFVPRAKAPGAEPELRYIRDDPLWREEQEKASEEIADAQAVERFNRRQRKKRISAKRRGKKMPIEYEISRYTVSNPTSIKDNKTDTGVSFTPDDYILIDLGDTRTVAGLTATFITTFGINVYKSDISGTEVKLLTAVTSTGTVNFTEPVVLQFLKLKYEGKTGFPCSLNELAVNPDVTITP